MSKVEQLEREVEHLSPEELANFRAWFAAFDAAEWDAKFERHASSGALDSLADAAIAEHRAGHSRPL
jgi:hypothetical protein